MRLLFTFWSETHTVKARGSNVEAASNMSNYKIQRLTFSGAAEDSIRKFVNMARFYLDASFFLSIIPRLSPVFCKSFFNL